MRKQSAMIICLIIGIVLITTGMVFQIAKKDKSLNWRSEHKWTIFVNDGSVDPGTSAGEFFIEKDGTYALQLGWTLQGLKAEEVTTGNPGFVTACLLKDDRGNVLYSKTGLAAEERVTLDLTAGNYHLDYAYFADRDAFSEYAGKWLCGSEQVKNLAETYDFDSFPDNGTWTMEYRLRTDLQHGLEPGLMLVVLGILLGTILVILSILALTKKKRLSGTRYDERQELEQGRGFRAAFFTVLASIFVTLILELTGITPGRDSVLLYEICIFIGIIVYVVYCIWHECYFALNEKRPTMVVIFLCIGAANLLLSVPRLIANGLYEDDGNVTTTVLNLMCAITCFVLLITMVVKKICDSRSLDAEDEE